MKNCTYGQNIETILESFSEAAERLEKSKCAEGVRHSPHCLQEQPWCADHRVFLHEILIPIVQVGGTKECFKKMLNTHAELAALRSAMRKLEQPYETPESDNETDFKRILEEAAAAELEHRQYVSFLLG